MNALRNKVRLIGRLGAQPELIALEGGKKLARFSLATNEPYKDKNGEWKTVTQWHSMIAWGNTATRVERQLAKGHEILMEGRIVNKVYETKTGEKRFATDIEMNEFLVISGNSDAKS